MRRLPATCLIVLPLLASVGVRAQSGIVLSNVPLWDGETDDASGNRLNRFGGNPVENAATVSRTTDPGEVRTGAGALKITTAGSGISAGASGSVATALAGFGPLTAYIDTRDLSPFDRLTFWIRNDTGEPFILALEIKDYRDDNAHRARRSYTIDAASTWRSISASLDLASGWTVSGTPDLTRTKLVTLVIEANQGSGVSGALIVDDMYLVEKGGPLDVDLSPADALVARLAERQFRALWGARDRGTGLLPRNSYLRQAPTTDTPASPGSSRWRGTCR